MLIETLFLTAPLQEANVLLEVKYVCVWESLDIWNFPCKYVLNKKKTNLFHNWNECDVLWRVVPDTVLDRIDDCRSGTSQLLPDRDAFQW